MSNKFFSRDEPAARAYEANQMSAAGHDADAQMIRRQPIGFSPLFAKVTKAIADLFIPSLNPPAAIAYEAFHPFPLPHSIPGGG